MKTYREKLMRILAASGWSQEGLAEKLGVSFVTLNKWVNARSQPRTGARERIDMLLAQIVGVDTVSEQEISEAKKRAKAQKIHLDELLASRDALDAMTLHLTYHSNATEGSSMTEGDVAAVLFEHKVLRNRTAIEQREAVTHQAALHFLLDEMSTHRGALEMTPELVKATHLRMMNGINASAGEYRSHGARIRGAHVPLVNYLKIPELMQAWCQVANGEADDVVAALAHAHAEFERIHPFSDGNGRTGRLLMVAMALSRGLYPPIIKKQRRIAYYKYLELAQTRQIYGPLEKFIAEAMAETAEEGTI